MDAALRTSTDFQRSHGALLRHSSRDSSRTQWTEDFVIWSWYGFRIVRSHCFATIISLASLEICFFGEGIKLERINFQIVMPYEAEK